MVVLPSPGVLEASANLEDAVKAFTQAPERLDRPSEVAELRQLYAMAASAGASTVLERCMRTMRDANESAKAKISAVRILDILMLDSDERLAVAYGAQARFFTTIAKRSKEKERKKRRPPGLFGTGTSDDEVAQFVAAVSELVDKWGRHFEQAAHNHETKEIAKARSELLEEKVKLPLPNNYRHLSAKVSPPGPPAGQGAAALDEAHVAKLAEDFRLTLERLGPEAGETGEAHSLFEAELDKWRRAAQEAAEKDDFTAYERYSEVAIRFSEIGQRLESSAATSAAASAASTPAASPSPPQDRAAAKEEGTASAASGGRRKRHHSRAKDPSSAGNEQSQGGHGFPEAPEAAGGFFPPVPQDPQDNFGGFGGSFGAFGEPPPGPPAAPHDPAQQRGPNGFFQQMGDMGLGGPPQGLPVEPDFSLPQPPQPPAEDREAAMLRMNQQLISQVQALQAHSQTLQAKVDKGEEGHHRSSSRRGRDSEHLRAELADSRATIGSLRELADRLQAELEQGRRELQRAKQRAEEAEAQLAEREDVITETRQRLFEVKSRNTQLEEELSNQTEAQRHLQGRLQSARADREISDLELQQLRAAVTAVGVGIAPQQPQQPRGNQSYAGSSRASLASSRGSRLASSLAVPPSVNKFDELADSAASGGGLAADELGDTPLQQLARRQSKAEGILEATAPEHQPQIPRSSLDLWQRTRTVPRPTGAIVAQAPAASRACLERTHAYFQQLLLQTRSPLYEDNGIVITMSIGAASSVGEGRPHIDFEVCVSSSSGSAMQEVMLRPTESGAHRAYDMHIEWEPIPNGRAQRRRFRGRLEAYGIFETGPQVDLGMLLPDNSSLRLRLRLPLAMTRFMLPANFEAGRVRELWSDAELAHTEVAMICSVGRGLLAAGAPFSVWKRMELGNVFRCFPGLDENPAGAIFASTFPQRDGRVYEVLVRAELGLPIPGSGRAQAEVAAAACRVAVRCASHALSQVLAQAFVDVLCDAPEAARTA